MIKQRSAKTLQQKQVRAHAKSTPIKATPAEEVPAEAPARPGGKLGLVVDHLGTEAGATIDELAGATGWQKHTVRAALSRLRTRGFAMRLDRSGERRAYQLAQREG